MKRNEFLNLFVRSNALLAQMKPIDGKRQIEDKLTEMDRTVTVSTGKAFNIIELFPRSRTQLRRRANGGAFIQKLIPHHQNHHPSSPSSIACFLWLLNMSWHFDTTYHLSFFINQT